MAQLLRIVSRVSDIGHVPVLGALFRSAQYRRQITELVMLATPEIIAPVNPGQPPPTPGEFISTLNESELYALG